MKSSMRRLIIDRLLTERELVTFAQLEEALQVSAPTIKRDLRFMREELGAPIRYSKARGGYYYEAEEAGSHERTEAGRLRRTGRSATNVDPFRRSEERPLLRSKQWYSSDELYVLTSTWDLLGALESDRTSALSRELAPLRARVLGLFTLGGTTPRDFMRHVRVVDRRVIYRESPVFELIGCALCERRRLHIRHRSRRTNEITEREISPLRLVHYRNRWYVDAYCHHSGALKTFLIENITHADILNTAVLRMSLDEVEEKLDAGYGIFHGAAVLAAKLHFNEEASRYVLREAWHPKQRVQKLEDGSLMLTVPYSDPTEIVGEILRWGSKVEVVEPPELRDAVADEAASIAARYGQ